MIRAAWRVRGRAGVHTEAAFTAVLTPSFPAARSRSTAGNGDTSIAQARMLPKMGTTCSVKTPMVA